MPLVVTAVAVVARSRGYAPVGDWALTELRVRDIGHHPVVTGLYSRDGWSHPGPMDFYLLAPLYRLARSTSVSIDVGALLVNAAAIVGMAAVARRRGGTPLLLCTLLGVALLERTLGAGFLADPWNTYVTVLPLACLVLLTWGMTCGERWALPAGAVAATFLAQTHVGFVVIALPLLAVGATWLAIRERRRALRPGLLAVALLVLLWLPVLVDVLNGAPDNLARIVDWFRDQQGTHSLWQGMRVVAGQLGGRPEWLVSKRAPFVLTGEPVFLYRAPFPWVLAAVVAAAVAFVRQRQLDGARLVAVFGATVAVAVIAVMRTVGLAFDYRLRWTWVLGMLAFVVVTWAVCVLLDRHRRIVVAVGSVALGVVCVVDVVAAATARPARDADSEVMSAIVPDVVDDLRNVRGEVVVDDGEFSFASDYGRALLLQLERRGFAARMLEKDRDIVGDHRIVGDGRVGRRLVVAQDDEIAARDQDPNLRPVARWTSVTPAQERAYRREVARLDDAVARGELSPTARAVRLKEISPGANGDALAWAVAVYEAP